MAEKLSELIDIQISDRDIASHWPDHLTVRRVREKALSRMRRETVAARKRMRMPTRILVASVALVLCFSTALAATGLGTAVANLFAGNEKAANRLAVLGLYGDAIGQTAADQDITITVEGAYADEGSYLLLYKLIDSQDRLTGDAYLSGIDWGGHSGGGASWSADTDKSGAADGVHMLFELRTDNDISGKRISMTISGIETSRTNVQEHLLPFDLAGAFGNLPAALPGLPGGMNTVMLTGLRFAEGGLVIEAAAEPPAGYPKAELSHIGLCAPDGDVIYPERSTTATYSDEGGNKLVTGFFPGYADLESLEGYTLNISYSRVESVIEGDWKLNFRMPKSDGGQIIPVGKTIAADGEEYLIESARIGRTGIVVDAVWRTEMNRRNEPPREVNSTDAWLTDGHKAEPIIHLLDEKGESIPHMGYYGFTGQAESCRSILTFETADYPVIEMVITHGHEGEELLRARLK